MFGVIFFTLSLTLVCASERRLINQLNYLKEDLSYVNGDISSIFKQLETINKIIMSSGLGSSVKGRKENAFGKEVDNSNKGALTFNHEMMTLKKGFQSEKKLNRRLLHRLKAAEKQNAENDKLLHAQRMEILDIESRLDAEIRTRNIEFANTMEKTDRLNLQLSEQVKTVEQSNAELQKELAQLRVDYGAVQDEVSELEVKHGTLKDELSEIKAQLQIENEEMKGNILLLAENVSKITESCDCITKTSPNTVTLQASTLILEGESTSPIPAPTSCKDQQTSGVYDIIIENSVKTSVYCDADTDAGGWIVIMRRQDGSVNFNTTWIEYKNGFGDVEGEFLIGNDFLHQLTNSKPMELRVDMEDKYGNKVFAKYSVFKVGSEADKYVLNVSGYSGTAVHGMDGYKSHNGMKFSTFDQDNDRSNGDCAGYHGGGWWYTLCYSGLLTGTWSTGEMFMVWYDGRTWRDLKFAEMKTR